MVAFVLLAAVTFIVLLVDVERRSRRALVRNVQRAQIHTQKVIQAMPHEPEANIVEECHTIEELEIGRERPLSDYDKAILNETLETRWDAIGDPEVPEYALCYGIGTTDRPYWGELVIDEFDRWIDTPQGKFECYVAQRLMEGA